MVLDYKHLACLRIYINISGKARITECGDKFRSVTGLDCGSSVEKLIPHNEYGEFLHEAKNCGSLVHHLICADKTVTEFFTVFIAIGGERLCIMSQFDPTLQKEFERFLKFRSYSDDFDALFFDYDVERDELFTSKDDLSGSDENNVTPNFLGEEAARAYVHPLDIDEFLRFMNSAIYGSDTRSIDYRSKSPDGKYLWYRLSCKNIGKKNLIGVVYCIDDMTDIGAEVRADRKEIERLTNTDPITGLYNKNAFVKFAKKRLKEIYTRDECFAIGYSDINDFSYVNENFGYEMGNLMLRSFADVIRECEANVVGCRIYSDYFVSLYHARSREELVNLIDQRNKKFTELQKQKYPMSDIRISCGLYFVKSPDEDMNVAIDNANLARRSVKGTGDIPSGIYSERMRAKRSHDQAIASEITTAINTGAIELFLQPKFDLETRKIIGAEALSRWRNADGSYKMPYEFIDVLESVGYITELDFYIYEQCLKCMNEWRSHGKPLLPLSINFSRKHNNNPDFVKKVLELAERYDIERNLIEIEVTESCFAQDVRNLFLNMKKLREYGFKVDIDDFGMGYSSLSVLMEAPVDIVKVDKVFIDNIDTSERSLEYINGICNLIKTTRKEIIFEGVETEKQAEILCENGHRMAQGWLFDKAIPVEEFNEKYYNM